MGRTKLLRQEPDYVSPAGVAEIREMLSTAGGELTHAVVPSGRASEAAWLDGLTEIFYVHAGAGAIWIDDGASAEEFHLRPGRAVLIPADARFQYRASDRGPLTIILAVTPRWERNIHHVSDGGLWLPTNPSGAPCTRPESAASRPIMKDVSLVPDYRAPDGSEIRLLPDTALGGLSHCVVQPGQQTHAVRHRSVTEVWFVLDGMGELARWAPGAEASPEVTQLCYGVAVDIETETPFQFRCTGADPLRILILTMPRWPGQGETDTSISHLNAWPA